MHNFNITVLSSFRIGDEYMLCDMGCRNVSTYNPNSSCVGCVKTQLLIWKTKQEEEVGLCSIGFSMSKGQSNTSQKEGIREVSFTDLTSRTTISSNLLADHESFVLIIYNIIFINKISLI